MRRLDFPLRPISFPQWFDGGYGGDMAAGIKTIIAQQKLAVGFGGSGVMDSPVGWVGTESGMPGAPHIWSTGGNGVGDPASTTWMPKCCDTTLQVRCLCVYA